MDTYLGKIALLLSTTEQVVNAFSLLNSAYFFSINAKTEITTETTTVNNQ